jgi:outer membrane protein assembly factor BamE (lipoprotein component of BamABCDE complex)
MTRTTNAAKACFAILLAVALSACATHLGRDFDDAYAQQIKPGQTTKAEVREKLGQPPLVSRKGDEETWTYAYYKGRGVGSGIMDALGFTDANLQGRGAQKRLTVTFNGDTVKDSRFKVELPVTND